MGKSKILETSQFFQFEGHHLILSRRSQFAMKGMNAEFGAHLDCYGLPFYAAVGPYYLHSKNRQTWGGKGRLVLNFGDYFRVEGSASYDRIFKDIYQGQASINFLLGRKTKSFRSCCPTDCCLLTRAYQRVDRQEIIVIDDENKKSLGINPLTNDPWFFWFVNNLSSSDGTFESPFNNLTAAETASSPHHVIYVYPGDRTSKGMDEGITLKNFQKLWGAGRSYPLKTTDGTIIIPELATGMPLITHTDNIVVCANDNEVAGLFLSGIETKNIECINSNNVTIHNNFLFGKPKGFVPVDVGPIFLQNCSGQILIYENTLQLDNLDLAGPIYGIQIFSTAPGAKYFIESNLIEALQDPLLPGSAATGVEFGDGRTSTLIRDFDSIVFSKNTFIRLGDFLAGKPVGGWGFNGTGKLVFDSNTFIETGAKTTGTNPPGLVFIRAHAGTDLTIEVTNNLWKDTDILSKSSFYLSNIDPTSSTCVTATGNITDTTPTGYTFNNSVGGTMITNVHSNIGSVVEVGTTPGICQP